MFRQAERGSSLAWTAIILASVFVPLLMVAGDGSRLFMVYTRLGSATDMACAELGYVLADRQYFLNSGSSRMTGKPWAQFVAYNFSQSLAGLNIPVNSSNFGFSLQGDAVYCTGTVSVPLLLIPGQQVTLQHVSRNRVRFISP